MSKLSALHGGQSLSLAGSDKDIISSGLLAR
jgi:hypothetical protein